MKIKHDLNIDKTEKKCSLLPDINHLLPSAVHLFSKNQKIVKKRVKKRWSLQKSQKSLKKGLKK